MFLNISTGYERIWGSVEMGPSMQQTECEINPSKGVVTMGRLNPPTPKNMRCSRLGLLYQVTHSYLKVNSLSKRKS